ncbi:TSUP family transporter [Rhodocyclus tenuis]|uniref:Probable membrane transporter protein n=1 Tax=Rhodocyclus tenuis TaxID=1066 RepID=A0A6L5JW07_RHOTE|nr:sulfite exporter TauE/SafE family protein [Rhodocyclus gracilis]MQY51419.1 TSUP family transporter [Rhodocyclus gracilis]MRD72161.1 TSUP family transporter [Rhodocyclus gracilis]
MSWVLAYLALGAFSGFFAGLLGIGGGTLMTPLLMMMFAAQAGFPPAETLHLALGTSMATIFFTSISSLRTHHQHGAVLWPVVLTITPGILFGTLLGTLLAARVPAQPLAVFFACFVCFVAVQMLLNFKPKPSRELPGKLGLFGVGTGIGGVSALVAIGGGALTVPFLSWCNVRVHNAIGTSSAVGLPIAIGASLGYIFNGWGHPGLPQWSLGFVYLPALACLAGASVLVAPIGARLAHRLPVATLKRVFAVLLVLLAAKMLFDVFA